MELLWDYSAVHRLSVVLDGVEADTQINLDMSKLLRQLGKAVVYITCCTYIPLETAFIRFWVERHYYEDEGDLLDDELSFVLEQAGGIPQNIINAVHLLHAAHS